MEHATVTETTRVFTGADAVVHGLESMYGIDATLNLHAVAAEPQMRLSRYAVGPLRVDRMEMPCRFSFTVHHFPDFAAMTVTAGRAAITSGTRHAEAATGGVWVPCDPDGSYQGWVDAMACETITLHPDLLRDVAGLPPDHPLHLHRLTPDGKKANALWTAASHHAYCALTAEPLYILEADTLARTLAAAALTAFPNTLTTPAPHTTGPGAVQPAALRRAVAFMDDHAHRPITLAQIAAAAGTTPRAVQYAMRRHYGMTPLTYLRRVRLARAHDELLAAEPHQGVLVQDVAARWGFTKPGNFSTAYRQVYGQTPSTTLDTESVPARQHVTP
ncbi:AraC family transcriptional regulator [Streptomyces sp. NPDC046832]|uniref:AraC family transcriptional regulator n=1 Tax=Streptomyces sp. NPDC046832 TaxID=3155020 RepID=UPI0033DC1F7B